MRRTPVTYRAVCGAGAALLALLAQAAAPHAAHAQAAPTDAVAALPSATAGSNAVEALRAALRGPRPDLAVRAIGTAKLTAAVPDLVALAANPDGELRTAAAWALGECGGADAEQALVTLAADPYPQARATAILALGKSTTAAGTTAVRNALTDREEHIRLAAVRALGASGRKDAGPLLAPLLEWRIAMLPDPAVKAGPPRLIETVVWQEPSARVRLAAVQAMGALGSLDSLPALVQALEREGSFNRLAIIGVLRAMGEPAAGACLGRIVPLPYDKESLARYLPTLVNNGTLAVIAGQLGDDRSVPYLVDVLKLPRGQLGQDKSLTELYLAAVELLGRFKVEKAARPLVELLKETSVSQLAAATETAIRAIGHPAARPLARNLDDWQMAPTFLRLLREPDLRTAAARDAIVGYLGHESDEVRLAATETLGLYLAEGVLEEYDAAVLESMYLDPNAEIRNRCAFWLAKLKAKQEDVTP